MKLLIDLQGAQTESRFRGIGRYTLSLARAMVADSRGHDVHFLLNGSFMTSIEELRADLEQWVPHDHVHVWFPTVPLGACAGGKPWKYEASRRIRYAKIRSLAPDVLHVSSVFEGCHDDAITDTTDLGNGIVVAATAYDLIPLIHPAQYLDERNVYTKFYHARVEQLRAADLLLAISESSRREVITHLPALPELVVNISAACGDEFRPIDPEAAKQAVADLPVRIPDRFVMYAGGLDERKNIPRLLEAFAAIPESTRAGAVLMMVGSASAMARHLIDDIARRTGLPEGAIVWTGFVTDRQLRALYGLCIGFVFPSTHEGFGLPALEAMACGAPTIVASSTSLVEIVSRSDARFDPHDTTDISHALTRLLTDSGWRDELARWGLKASKQFSWAHCARTAWQAIESTLAERRVGDAAAIAPTGADRHPVKEPDAVAHQIADAGLLPASDRERCRLADALVATFPMRSTRRLLVDVTQLARNDHGTGIQRVVRSVLTQLKYGTALSDFEVLPVASDDRWGYRSAVSVLSRLNPGTPAPRQIGQANSGRVQPRMQPAEVPITPRPDDVFLGLDLSHEVVVRNSAMFALWRAMGVAQWFVVYDLLPLQMPELFPFDHTLHERWLQNIALADGIVCISRTVASEVRDWLDHHPVKRHKPLKLGWFHLGADFRSMSHAPVSDAESRTARRIASRPSFLMVGTMEPRKGHRQALDAFEWLWARGHDVSLVIVGRMGWKTDDLVRRIRTHGEFGERLIWLEGISDAFLDEIYRSSAALLNASVGEGFGLPLIEAQQHRKIAISRDLPVFREVADRATQFFSGSDPGAIADAIIRFCQHAGENQVPEKRVPLSWEESARQLMRVVLDDQWTTEWLAPGVHRDRSTKQEHAADGPEGSPAPQG